MTKTSSESKALWTTGPNTAMAVAARNAAKDAYALTRKSAIEGLFRNYDAIADQRRQTRIASAQSSDEITRRAAQIAAATVVNAGSTGGRSLAALLRDVHQRKSESEQALLLSQELRERQGMRQAMSERARAYQMILDSASRIPHRSTIVKGWIDDIELGLKLGSAMGGAA